jgi:putative membrane protein
MLFAAHPLVHVNATLNAVAAVLLVVGYVLIKRGQVLAHKRVMLTAFGVSIVFLGCYLWYHYQVGSVRFTHPGIVKTIYLVILLTHVVLAATVPVLAVWTIYLGLRATGSFGRGEAAETGQDLAVYRAKHRRMAWWTFPIWLYVSVTGVVVYVMLYHLWPPTDL